ncbi:MAG: hypothetical protein KatS3mg050_3605 [Litorilinea sp.]|nr:MAG: hypothetical protein KatS3mg050_3605 [Litorilinea sp.]
MIIQSIDVVPLNLHYTPELMAHMPRSAHRGRLVLYRVHLADGTVGYGEEIGDPQDPAPYVGTDAVAGLRAIRHTGVQMACYDAVGKALGVPAHALMGRQVRRRVPFAYWTIDLPPDVWAAQAARAASLGYTVYKFKCRPWWDPVEQVARAAQVVPKGFTFWLDFNGHLREVRQALPVLQALAQYDCVGGFESPIPQRDAAGYRLLRQKIDRPIAAHFGSGCCHVRSDPGFDRGVPALTQITEGLCDAFVFGGGDVETLRSQAAVAAEARIPFWIQTVGGGLRAAWVMHLASTCRAGDPLSPGCARDLGGGCGHTAQANRRLGGRARRPRPGGGGGRGRRGAAPGRGAHGRAPPHRRGDLPRRHPLALRQRDPAPRSFLLRRSTRLRSRDPPGDARGRRLGRLRRSLRTLCHRARDEPGVAPCPARAASENRLDEGGTRQPWMKAVGISATR